MEELETDRDVIKVKLDELRCVCSEYSTRYTGYSKKLNKCVAFHQLVKTAENWWTSCLHFIASMNMEHIQTQGGINKLKNSLDEFRHGNPEIEVSQVVRMTELAHHLGHHQVTKAEQTNSRCVDAKSMLEAKKNQILGAEQKIQVHIK